MISETAYQQAADELGVDIATIKAVSEVESSGDGFIGEEPKILFERHIFSRETGGKYDQAYPDISNKTPGGYGLVSQQHARLQKASSLDRDAALRSASWGRFQIMGFNYKAAGYPTLQAFINGMYKSEDEQLKAFVNFIKSEGLAPYLQRQDWAAFARRYNGPAYAQNSYDKKLAAAYRKFSA